MFRNRKGILWFWLIFLIGNIGWIIAGCTSSRPTHVFSPPVMDQEFENVLKDGIAAYETGELKHAKRIFQDFIVRHPGSPLLLESQWMLGQTYERQGSWKRALLEYELLLLNDRENSHAVEARLRIELLKELLRQEADKKDYPLLLGTTVTNTRSFLSRIKEYRSKGYNTFVLDVETQGNYSKIKAMTPFISVARKNGFYVLARVILQPLDLFEHGAQNDLKHRLIDVAVSGMDGVLFDDFGIIPDVEFHGKAMDQFLRDSKIKIDPEKIIEDQTIYWRWVGWRSREVIRILKEAVAPILNTRNNFYWGIIFSEDAIMAPHRAVARTGLDLLEAKRHGLDYFGIRSLDNKSSRLFMEKANDLIGDPNRIVMVVSLSGDGRKTSFHRSFNHGFLYLNSVPTHRVP